MAVNATVDPITAALMAIDWLSILGDSLGTEYAGASAQEAVEPDDEQNHHSAFGSHQLN